MNEDLPYIGISGYWKEGEGNNAKRFVTTKNAQGRGSIVEVGAETQDGYKILDYDEEKNIAVISRGGFKYNLPANKSVILDSNKSNPYNPSWNNTLSQYSDALSLNDLQNLEKFKQKNETFNSMIEDATGMPLYEIKEKKARMDALKRITGLTGQLSDDDQKMLGSYTQDPMQELPDKNGILPNQNAIMIWDNVNPYEHNEERLNKIIGGDYNDAIKHSAKQGLEYLKQMKTSESPELGFTRQTE